ncbi:MAG: hypothetical protein ACT4QD_07270 [Acidobacteriota bacterium]
MTSDWNWARSLIAAVALAGFAPASLMAAGGPQAQAAPVAGSPAVAPPLSLEQQEAFLKTAKIVRTRGAQKGVTATVRATLSDGTLTHDVSIQVVDEYKHEFRSQRGTELNFRDSWHYNVAAYRLDRLLELNMIPPSVARSYHGKPGAFTWWVDDVLMEEGQRLKGKVAAPDPEAWNEQMWHVRLFDQLIHNVDRNLGNLLIDKTWKAWMIDHTRAFRLFEQVKSPESLSKIDRRVFERLKGLTEPALKAAVEDHLTGPEVRAVLARRDDIVARFEKAGSSALIDRRTR